MTEEEAKYTIIEYMPIMGFPKYRQALRMAINALEKQTKIKEFTKLYEQTFDWGCNDEAKVLFANAIYSIVSGRKNFKECEQEFLDYMADSEV